jgi:hypothetical protein
MVGDTGVKEESSFLKKRSKKLLRIALSQGHDTLATTRTEMSKSFLVLFFKKEHFFS